MIRTAVLSPMPASVASFRGAGGVEVDHHEGFRGCRSAACGAAILGLRGARRKQGARRHEGKQISIRSMSVLLVEVGNVFPTPPARIARRGVCPPATKAGEEGPLAADSVRRGGQAPLPQIPSTPGSAGLTARGRPRRHRRARGRKIPAVRRSARTPRAPRCDERSGGGQEMTQLRLPGEAVSVATAVGFSCSYTMGLRTEQRTQSA